MFSIQPYPYVVQIDPIDIVARVLTAITSLTVVWLIIVVIVCALYYYFKRKPTILVILKLSIAHALFLVAISIAIAVVKNSGFGTNALVILGYFAPFMYYIGAGKLWNNKNADKILVKQFSIAIVPFGLIALYIAAMLALEAIR